MIVPWRYHLASLVAVFLALGLGIVIGLALGNNRFLLSQQTVMVDRLAREMASIRAGEASLQNTISDLRNQLSFQDRFARAALPYTVRGQLMGRRVAIWVLSDLVGNDTLDAVSRVVKLAGASVTSITSALAPFSQLKGWENQAWAAEAEAGQQRFFLQALVHSLIYAQPDPVVDYLVRQHAVTIRGDYKTAPDAVIILTGSLKEDRSHWDQIDQPLIQTLQSYQVPVVMGEPLSSTAILADRYGKMGVPAVDNVDGVAGQAALVLALASGQPGRYGQRGQARQLLPEPGWIGL